MDYWTEKKARWYSEALKMSDYAEKALGVLEGKVRQKDTVLDIGAGCGALALPLASRAKLVTAIEPSDAMIRILEEEAASQGLSNLRSVPYRWEDCDVDRHDVVICANIRSLLQENIRFLASISSYASRYVFVISGVGTQNDKFFLKELYPMLFQRRLEPKKDYLTIYQNLHELGIYANVEVIHYNMDQVFADLDEALDFWKEYLSLRGNEHDPLLREFLKKRLVREESGWRVRIRKHSAVMWWSNFGR